ncbi:ATP-binding protein [Microvirga yunnanensis]|uniref:ATP-binding protein n=1 Tax=Microvirga yunnanensis TaxID=2953740 RepID=UPI0021C924DF|nr:ATP-binding protein [Microvirga sp. HBU65207]
MQIKETIGLSLTGSVEGPLLEDVVVLVDSAGVALGVQRACNARVPGVCNGDSGFIASRCVEIPVVGSDGGVCGVMYHNDLPSDGDGAVASGERERIRAIADMAQFAVHDINNLLTVIGSGLRLLECQSDAGRQKAIIGKMQEAITRGALLIRQLLDEARPQPKPIDGVVAGNRLVAIAGTLDRTLRSDITVRTEIATDLWTFNADPEELYFALLNLCRNSADAMPGGGVITVAARNVEASSGVTRGLVEIVVADHGEGMPEEVLSQALDPYFTTKPAGSGTGLGLPQVQRFAEGRDGAVCIESVRGIGTLVRLFLPRVQATGLPISIVGT